MKNIFSASYTLIVLFIATNMAKAQSLEWKELDDFHSVLAFTYHPMVDENNFEPIKNRSGELYEKAVTLKKGKLPKHSPSKDELKALIDSLVTSSKELDDLIKAGATNDIISEKLSVIHQTFHSIEHKASEE